MGNKQQSSFDYNQVTEIANDICNEFQQVLPSAYNDSVVEAVRRDHEVQALSASLAQSQSLLTAPPPSYPIKKGEMLKKGIYNTAWKRRFFVLTNKSENFVMHYYEDETEQILKGSISCLGYRVCRLSASDSEKHGRCGFSLCHADITRRKWFFKTDDESEFNEWKEALSYACRNAVSGENGLDSIAQAAFIKACKSTRASYGFFGNINYTGKEHEMLEDSMLQILRREIYNRSTEPTRISEVYSGQNAAAVEAVTEDGNLETAIRPIIAKTCQNMKIVFAQKSALLHQSKQQIHILNTLELQLKQSISSEIYSIINPTLVDEKIRILTFLTVVSDPIALSFELAWKSIHNLIFEPLKQLRKRDQLSELNVEKLLSATDEHVEKLNDGVLSEAKNVLWDMFVGELASQSPRIFSSGDMTPFHIYHIAMDSLRLLIRNSVFTLRVALKNQFTIDNDLYTNFSALCDLLKTLHLQGIYQDMMYHHRSLLTKLLTNVLEFTMQEMMFVPCGDIVKEISSSLNKNIQITNLTAASLTTNNNSPFSTPVSSTDRRSISTISVNNQFIYPQFVIERVIREHVSTFIQDQIQPTLEAFQTRCLLLREQLRKHFDKFATAANHN